jgi:hypothetical protein
MYRQLARWFQEQARDENQPPAAQIQTALKVFEKHPLQLARFLDEAWFARADADLRPSLALPDQDRLLPQLSSFLDRELPSVCSDIYPLSQAPNATFHHLIYAYLIENTRIYEIFRRVLHEYLHGERLEVASVAGQHFLRATEDLFYKDTPPFVINSLTSWIRPDIGATRRNAYWRMFAMDLNHGPNQGGAYPYEKAQAANLDFVSTFEALLREVWRGIENFNNSSGPNTTDDTAIANLAQQLFDMLRVRRQNGTLAREEFFFVTTMSWFHLAVEFNSPIVVDLKAEATSPEERLRKIGERVGIPAHAKSESYFLMAEPLSRILIGMERGQFSTPSGAQTLYFAPTGTPNPIRDDMQTIITHWSIATGRDMKAPARGGPAAAPAVSNGQARAALPAGT